MVTNNERKLIRLFLWLKLWSIQRGFTIEIVPRKGTRWILQWLLRRQKVDNLKHAPLCPANHFHRKRLVFQPCTCGANVDMCAWINLA